MDQRERTLDDSGSVKGYAIMLSVVGAVPINPELSCGIDESVKLCPSDLPYLDPVFRRVK